MNIQGKTSNQFLSWLAPVLDRQVPDVQAIQYEEELASEEDEQVPAEHNRQVALDVAVRVEEYVPGIQDAHTVACPNGGCTLRPKKSQDPNPNPKKSQKIPRILG